MSVTEIVDSEVSNPGGRAADPPELARHLASLLRMKMAGREWAVSLAVLLSTEPITAKEVGRRTRIAYPHATAIIRTLVAWGMLERRRAHITFQGDPARWGPPRDP